MIDLPAIKARQAKATPGEWRVLYATSGNRRIAYMVESGEVCIAHLDQRADEAKAIDDADFIAHAPADVAALVAEVEGLRAEVAALRGTDPYREDRIDLDDDGILDDVAIAAARFRLERMSLGAWWMHITRPGKPGLTVNLGTRRPTVTAITPNFYEEPE